MYDVVTLGETMIRLNPPGFGRLESSDSFEVNVGGSESNTAIALAGIGRQVAWVSKLPKNPLGRRIAGDVRRHGVDVSRVIWTGNGRVGLYFLEIAGPPRGYQIEYDRAGSVACTLQPQDIDWAILDSARHLHVTGITVALSESCAATVSRGIQEAGIRKVPVSLDVNYRRKLWTPEAARQALAPIVAAVDLVICPSEDASEVFGFGGSLQEVARRFRDELDAKTIVVTGGAGGAVALQGENSLAVRAIESSEVDRVGSGDAFSAGVIDGFLDSNLERGLQFGTAMAALKRTIPGDELIATREEVESVLEGAPQRIRR